MKMKLSDFVAQFLRDNVAKHAFAITGGASLHLMHSIHECDGLNLVCPQHEQAAAMAADGYARANNKMGVAIATSGPGATNLLTGVCSSYYDSIPVMYITGQVSTFRSKGELGVRQCGFQETDTIDIFKSVTKYCVLVKEPKKIKYELEKALFIANNSRPGPVLIDIPDNIQRTLVSLDELESFMPPNGLTKLKKPLTYQISKLIDLLNESQRPVIVIGWGVTLSKIEYDLLDEFIKVLNIPVMVTWGTNSLIPENSKYKVGTFGTHGTRHGNFTIQNSDFVLSIGSRLDTHAVGSPFSSFARMAKKVFVDIDLAELKKFEHFELKTDILIESDASEFIKICLQSIKSKKNQITPHTREAWWDYIYKLKSDFPTCLKEYHNEQELNPYVFVKELSKKLSIGELIYSDTGCGVAWMMQSFEFKEKQKFFHAFNNTPMGYGLPAAIGGSLAIGGNQVICISGDAGLQMNVQELATVAKFQLPIKIFLIDNKGHGMVQQTQDQWFKSSYIGTSVEGGLPELDFVKIANAYGIRAIKINRSADLSKSIDETLKTPGPIMCVLEIDQKHRVLPLCKFGRPIEDSEPLLKREEFFKYMIIEPAKESCYEEDGTN